MSAAVFFGAIWSASAAMPDSEAGKAQFIKSCGVCHATDLGAPPRQGPNLSGVFGRKAGSQPAFAYSPALGASDVVWNEETLERWLTDAKSVVPGSTMPYRQADPEKRRLIIDYLKTLTP
ncbi:MULTISPECIES: c-type cytochrome [Rhodomicrobium]|uniref:c-type cytochrome n=1 Tax=Rhodomicrobium TaxID=1068 RepID=UPI000B4B38EB|nr:MULTISPECIES: c-type cytochrome [Rhodomicrobium]